MMMKLKLRTVLILSIAVLLAGWIGSLVWHGFGLFDALKGVQGLADGGLGRETVAEASILLERADYHANRLYWGLAPLFPAAGLMGELPGVGVSIAQLEPLLMYGAGLASAGNHLLQAVGPALAADAEISQSSLASRLLASIEQEYAHLTLAQQAVDQAASARARFDASSLPGKLGEQVGQLDERFQLIQGGVHLLAALPGLGGAHEAQTYLLVVQNSDELRATGGFISAFGLIEVKNGGVVRFEVQDSYAVDNFSVTYPPPPDPISTYMLSGYWVPRDANWSPDFPTAARKIAELYTLSTGVAVDGVVAIDQMALVMLLGGLGPVNVSGASEPVSAQNVIAWMQRSWEPDPAEGASGEWWVQRKDFMKNLGSAMLDQVMGMDDGGALMQTAVASLQAMQAGHIQFFSFDAAAQTALERAGLDGAVRLLPGDFLLVVDTNMGFNKADATVKRQMQYQVDLSRPEAPRAALLLDYSSIATPGIECLHQGYYGLTYADLQQRCYWNYWRVLTAGGSQLLTSQVAAVPAEWLLNGKGYQGVVQSIPAEGGTMEYSGLLVLPSGTQQLVALNWTLPPGVLQRQGDGWLYRLRVQKQAGVVRTGLRLVVIAPTGQALEIQDGWREGAEGEWIWEGGLEETLDFTLSFH